MSIENMFSKTEERSRLETIYWAFVLMWAGLVFAMDAMGYLPQVGSADVWSWLFLGAGLYGIVSNLYHTAFSKTLTPTTFDYIWSGFWLLVGVSGFFTIDFFWPLVLILIGASALVKSLRSS